ncbi:MAG: Hpt domain-containing protein [Bryobacter sp.]|jgi:HPt (histidine-containing phosphotransfer) domain-containing protein|nr:Hpt domain-containing protein [Bryobacter sp. CoA8 C33]
MVSLVTVLLIGPEDACPSAVEFLRKSIPARIETARTPAEAVSSLLRRSWPLVVLYLGPTITESLELARTLSGIGSPGPRWGLLPYGLGRNDQNEAAKLARSIGLDRVLPASAKGVEWQAALASLGPLAFAQFDEGALIERLLGNEQLARLVVNAFLLDVPAQLLLLEQALDAGDIASSARAAHSIRGAAANAGSDSLVPIARQIEQALNNGDIVFGKELLPELAGRFLSLRPRLERFCS